MNALIQSTRRLAEALRGLEFLPPVAQVYRPLDYAWQPHQLYLQRFGNGPKRVLFLGMNPGPFGMAQTGVPFGEITAVRDWMGSACGACLPPDIQRLRTFSPDTLCRISARWCG